MSAAHTPGPWFVTDTRISGRLAIGWAEGTVAYVALPDSDNTELADARLIAAAPELLEALDEAYGELAADSTRDGPRCLLLTRIEAALAKARGEA